MIGGNDINIETSSPSELAEQILKLIQLEWQKVVVEDAVSGEAISVGFPFFMSLPNEFFVYKNASMKESWDELGACAENTNTMFHILLQDRLVTIVVDDPAFAICQNVVGAAREFARDLSLGRLEFAK